MPAQLLIAPIGAGKTAYALAQLVKTAHQHPLQAIWVLLPTARQEDSFRTRLAQLDPARPVYFNVHFFNFYSLYTHLLNQAGQPQRELDPLVRARLLRQQLLDQRDQFHLFKDIADKAGFAAVVGDFIYELKQNRVMPKHFEGAAQTPKDRDLALIYTRYQALLRERDLVDREGEGWLALRTLGIADDGDSDEAPPIVETVADRVQLLIVDGFDQFNPLQRDLLAALCKRARNALITLPTIADAETTSGRRFSQAAEQLQQSFHEQQTSLAYFHLPPDFVGARYVASAEGQRRGKPTPLQEQIPFPPLPEGEGLGVRVSFLEAPTPAQEAAALLRHLKRLLINGQAAPDDILIALRDWASYGHHLATAAQEYGLPLALHFGEALTDNPAVIALLNLLRLSSENFPRRAVLDMLRSPYFSLPELDAESVQQLDRLSRERLVISGADEWLEAIRHSQAIDYNQDDEYEREYLHLVPAEAQRLTNALQAFFARVSPPSQDTLGNYVVWVENLIGADTQASADDETAIHDETLVSLKMPDQCRLNPPQAGLVQRDLAALRAVKGVLRGLITTQILFDELGLNDQASLSWALFLRDLQADLAARSLEREPNRSGKILVTTVTAGRGLPHGYVCLPGLSQGIFPAPVPSDPLYLDSERLALQSRRIHLDLNAEQSNDDGVFYELLGAAQDGVILSRPTVQNGTLWPESHLWRAMREQHAHTPVQKLGLGEVVAVDEAATLGEALISAAAGLNQPIADQATSAVYNWLTESHSAAWGRLRAARNSEARRMSDAPHDAYTGRLHNADLIASAAAKLGADKIWSASQFNELGQCAFRFFAHRMLKLEALDEPEEGLDVMQRGTLIHAILEHTYRQLANLPDASITPEYLETALTFLHDCAARQFAAAPEQLGFRASSAWEHEKRLLLRDLEKLVRLDFSADSPLNKLFGEQPRRPYRLEQTFSAADDRPLTLTIAPELGVMRLRGAIDRLDQQGGRVIILDYKSGSTAIPLKDMERGRNYQMLTYLLATQQLLVQDDSPAAPREIAGGMFWHLTKLDDSKDHFNADDPDHHAALHSGQAHLARQVILARAGDFASEANKLEAGKCAHHCDYSQFCRVSITHQRKRKGGD